MLKVLKREGGGENNSPRFYFSGMSHCLVIIQSGQKFTSPAIRGIAPR
jgi:hypothetical protein